MAGRDPRIDEFLNRFAGCPGVEERIKAQARHRPGAATFLGFDPSGRRDYVERVTAARGEETRTRRPETGMEWMADGKIRSWEYALN